ncbi:MAG: hypothetical protein E7445_06800 [Ruminococcaceae bacterium]|nr:hypothetical protein [Oscillospiraceae bacterium]
MLDTVFMQVIDMTKAASIVIVCVLLVRLLMKKAPRIFSYALWAVVLFRLLCPASIQAPVSVVPEMKPVSESYTLADVPISFAGASQAMQQAVGDAWNGGLGVQHIGTTTPNNDGGVEVVSSSWWEVWILFGQYVWLVGIGVLAVYSTISCILLRRRLVGSVPLEDNIYLADGIDSPFVMGLFRPKIYLPSSLPEQERSYIILHEQHHIRRGDHIIKALAFFALCIHWFNPLVWAAFILSSKDMEMSCDEAVVKQLGEEIRADYSASLLSLATGRRIIAGTPLAFGEGDTKSRIQNMLRWKRPRLWVTVSAAAVCLVIAIVCGLDPQTHAYADPPEDTGDAPIVSVQPGTQEGQPVPPVPQPNTPEPSQPSAETIPDALRDVSYHLELAAGEVFRNMGSAERIGILAEYEELLDNYTLMARETEDGKTAYIAGHYNGAPTESPLHGMYSMEYSTGDDPYCQLLYRESDSAAVEEALAAQRTPPVGCRIEDSRIFWSPDSGLVLIQPADTALSLDVAWNRYLYTPNGREYIQDAVSRGIDVCGRTDTYLYVYLISPRFGEIAERIALTGAEAQAIASEERVHITDGFGFSASLHMGGETTYYNERSGIPQTVLDLAVERCDYRFGDPSYITDTIREARLDCDWLDVPLYAGEKDLPQLRKILKNAEQGYVGACGYGAKLTLTFTGGEKLTLFKGCDGCDSIVFGSYGGYFLGNRENTAFWEMFGLDPDSKLPLGENPLSIAPPTEGDIHNAIMTNNRWTNDPNALYPFRTEAHHIWGIREEGSRCAVYALVYATTHVWGNGQPTRLYPEQLASAKMIFTWDGAWQLTDFWMPGEDEDAASGIRKRFPADMAALALGEISSDLYASLNTRCSEAAAQYYAALTDLPPAKTFTPADVNFSDRPLTTVPDEMTYDARLAWATADPNMQQSHTSLGRYAQGDGCIAYLGEWIGTPHGNQYTFHLRFADGSAASLPLPGNGGWGVVPPDTMTFRDGRLLYEITFSTEAVTDEGKTLVHLQGTYHYEVDLSAKTVSLTVLQ